MLAKRATLWARSGFSLDGMSPCTAARHRIPLALVGPPQYLQPLAAVASGLALGYDLGVITRALATCTGAPGRFERVAHAGDFAVVVDYAHSDDALLNVLRTARQVTEGRIITVFGCGGDRDGSKRAPMGETAEVCATCDFDFRQPTHGVSRKNSCRR